MRYTFGNEDASTHIERAVNKVLAAGYRTGDIFEQGMNHITCSEMGDRVVAAM